MDRIHNTAASAAKAIRVELKTKFPGIKFSVRSSTFAGGNSIDVSWTDGPTDAAVGEVIGKYQYGNFDGMTDCYNYEPTHVVCEDGTIKELGGAKYVHSHRKFSEAAVEACTKAAQEYYREWLASQPEWERQTIVRRLLSRADLRTLGNAVRLLDGQYEAAFVRL
jgi:hypothetical protein